MFEKIIAKLGVSLGRGSFLDKTFRDNMNFWSTPIGTLSKMDKTFRDNMNYWQTSVGTQSKMDQIFRDNMLRKILGINEVDPVLAKIRYSQPWKGAKAGNTNEELGQAFPDNMIWKKAKAGSTNSMDQAFRDNMLVRERFLPRWLTNLIDYFRNL